MTDSGCRVIANCAKSHQQAATKALLAAVDICIESLSLVEFIPGRRFENLTVARSGTGLKVGDSGTSTTDDRSILRNHKKFNCTRHCGSTGIIGVPIGSVCTKQQAA